MPSVFYFPLCLSPSCALHLLVAVLGLDEVGKGLGLGNLLGVVAVSVVVVVLGSNVLHLVDAAALGASLHRALLGKLRIYPPLACSIPTFHKRRNQLAAPVYMCVCSLTPSQITVWESAG